MQQLGDPQVHLRPECGTSPCLLLGEYKQAETRWIETAPCHPNWYGDGRGRVYGKTLPSLDAKELRRTGLMEALQDNQRMDPEKYLAVLHNIPQLEQLAKAHMPVLVEECMSSFYSFKEAFKKPGILQPAEAPGDRLAAAEEAEEEPGWAQLPKMAPV